MSNNGRDHKVQSTVDLAEEPEFSLGALRVRPSSREVVSDGQAEMLEPRVMQVLVALARRNGEVVSRDQLVELCWSGRAVSEDALNRSIAKVRKLASDATFTLETIPRIGYRLTAVAARSESQPQQEPAPQPEKERAAPAKQARSPSRWRRIAVVMGAVVILLILVSMGIALWQFSVMTRPFFAVLPFDVIGTDPRAAALADAIPTAISSQLTAQGYKIISPTVTFQYRGDRKAAAATQLKSRYIIDGSVRLEGEQLHVTARVDWAAEPMSIWSQDFSVDVNRAQELPEQVSTAFASLFNPGVRIAFGNPPETTAAIIRIGSRWRAGDDMGAYVAAREFMRRIPGDLTIRIYFAIAAGYVLDLLQDSERAGVLAEARKVAKRAAKQAWSGAPMVIYLVTPPVEWGNREQVVRTGLSNEYSDASGLRRLLATHLASSGRLSEALTFSDQALDIDRLSPMNIANHIVILDMAGRMEEAGSMLERSERSWPGLQVLERLRFSTAITRRDMKTAETLLSDPRIGPVIDPQAESRPYAAIVRALRTRDPADVSVVERECAHPSKLARDRSRVCLQALVMLDRLDTFFEVAPVYFPEQRGATAEQRDARWLADPQVISRMRVLFRKDMHAVRADERFIPIVERTGLLDYWRESGKWPDFCESEPASVCGRMRAMQ